MPIQLTRLISVLVIMILSGCTVTQPRILVGLNFNSTSFKDTAVFEGSDSSDDVGFTVGGEIDPGKDERVIYQFNYQQLGDTEFDGTFMGVDDVGQIETEMVTVAAGYRYPFSERFSAGGRVGGAAVMVDESEVFGGVPESGSADEVVPFGGVMVRYALTDRFAVTANFDRYLDVGKDGETGESDIDVFGLNFTWEFGN